jgi:hypothetical protein
MRNIQMLISPEPVELFSRLKKQIKAFSMLYRFPSTLLTMQAMEMVKMAFKNGSQRHNGHGDHFDHFHGLHGEENTRQSIEH